MRLISFALALLLLLFCLSRDYRPQSPRSRRLCLHPDGFRKWPNFGGVQRR